MRFLNSIVDSLWMCVRSRFLTRLAMVCLGVLQFGQVGCGNTDDQNSPKLVTGIDNQVSLINSSKAHLWQYRINLHFDVVKKRVFLLLHG